MQGLASVSMPLLDFAEPRRRMPFGTSYITKTLRLHPIEKLADVALGHQQRVGHLLLGSALGGTDVGQHIKLAHAQPFGT